MTFLDKLERAFGRLAIPQLSLLLVIGQVGVYFALMLHRVDGAWFVLVPQLVLAGQWWRLFTFLLMPPPTGILFIAFAWWLFYLMGTALEEAWGAFRYNLFLLVGYAFTVGLAFLQPVWPVANTFLAGSVFLAFAILNPNFELMLFFFLPVKVRWLALATWVFYVFRFISGDWPERLQIIASTGNILLFFGGDAWRRAGAHRRRIEFRAAAATPATRPGNPRHRCRICGKTDLSNPELDFRYCSKCAGDECYCPEHIFNHEHAGARENGREPVHPGP